LDHFTGRVSARNGAIHAHGIVNGYVLGFVWVGRKGRRIARQLYAERLNELTAVAFDVPNKREDDEALFSRIALQN
jgi:hypothetical protein